MPKKPFSVDTSVFISAKNGPYRFSVFPMFWGFLDEQLEKGTVQCTSRVYGEIVHNEGRDDDLARWFRNRRDNGLNVRPNKEVQAAYTRIANYVSESGRWEQPHVNEFLRGADGWVIAHALATGGTVVTLETREHPDAKKVRIPDVAAHFRVKCVTTIEMLELLGAEFKSQKTVK